MMPRTLIFDLSHLLAAGLLTVDNPLAARFRTDGEISLAGLHPPSADALARDLAAP